MFRFREANHFELAESFFLKKKKKLADSFSLSFFKSEDSSSLVVPFVFCKKAVWSR